MSKKRFKSAQKSGGARVTKSHQGKDRGRKFKEPPSLLETISAPSYHSLARGLRRAVTGKTPGKDFDCGVRACQLCAPNRRIDWKEIEEIWNKAGKKK